MVLPQIARAALPALVNEMTLMIKVSPAVAVIGVTEVTRAAVRIGAATYNPIPPFLVALAIYIVVIGAFVAAQRMLERRAPRRLRMIPRGIEVLWDQRDALLSGFCHHARYRRGVGGVRRPARPHPLRPADLARPRR